MSIYSELRNLTKADLLSSLRESVAQSVVDDFLVFTAMQWLNDSENVLQSVKSFFGDKLVVVRSSPTSEVSSNNSFAGYYHSELNVDASDVAQVARAIDKVIASYSKNRMAGCDDQLLIQLQVKNVVVSGVVFTRDLDSNAPYYVINYDRFSGRTDTVTKGLVNEVLRIAQFAQEPISRPWGKLISAVQEIEGLCPDGILGIEFAIDRECNIHLLQVRLMQEWNQASTREEDSIAPLIQKLRSHFIEHSSQHRHLAGEHTAFADMPDWNPAEIIGGHPNMLDYSLYRFLITESVWNQARVSIGYTDVAPAELMVMLADKPYIDVRVSFNSLTPDGLLPSLKERLVNYYLDRLSRHPELQDKVEFEIVFTCYDLCFDDRYSELKDYGFSDADLAYLNQYLLGFTNRLLQESSRLIRKDLDSVSQLKEYSSADFACATPDIMLEQARQLLLRCRELGAFPFSRLARLAFVGLTLLRGLLMRGVISKAFFDDYLNSMDTIVNSLKFDFHQLFQGIMSLEEFLERYGHLRPGTYNILAPRYDHIPGFFREAAILNRELPSVSRVAIDQTMTMKIDSVLSQRGIRYPAPALFDFVQQTVKFREYAKFEFSKSLSDAIELIALAGMELSFSREEMAMMDLDTIMQMCNSRRSDVARVLDLWRGVVEKNRETKVLYDRVALPPVVLSDRDLVFVPYYEPSPNFVTSRRIEGMPCLLEKVDFDDAPNLKDKIILIESADPGYDWIFSQYPKGLVTKYGGVASHMAIRCAELGLPAAIGCGQVLYDRLAMAEGILIDCARKFITPMNSYSTQVACR